MIGTNYAKKINYSFHTRRSLVRLFDGRLRDARGHCR
ncbi:MAG: hypothetical protein UZ17_ACD001000806 [Acidobacteria bacterium OLB17]|nr:MAG: hypothetical protein UZ17_ACD001000806 [Acidobacteria bacterium OLB17]